MPSAFTVEAALFEVTAPATGGFVALAAPGFDVISPTLPNPAVVDTALATGGFVVTAAFATEEFPEEVVLLLAVTLLALGALVGALVVAAAFATEELLEEIVLLLVVILLALGAIVVAAFEVVVKMIEALPEEVA